MNRKILAFIIAAACALTATACGKADAPIPADALTETLPIPETEPATEVITEPETEAEIITEPETEPEPIPETEPETEPIPETEAVPETEPPVIAVASVTLNASEYTLKIGYALTLTAAVKPSDAFDKSIKWSSSDASVAMVEGGKITALKAGSATITAASSNGKAASCVITVPESVVEVAAVTLDKAALTLEVGQSATLTASVSPANASDRSVTVSSSNPAAAYVSGLTVTAKAAGSAVITVAAKNGVSASCAVTITTPEPPRTAETPAETPTETPAEAPAPLRTAKKEATATPKIVGKTYSANDRLAIAGTAPIGSTVVAEGGKEIVEYYVYDGIFLLDIPYSGSSPISIYAKSDGKEDSAAVSVATKGLQKGGKGLTVGKDGHLHIDATVNDYLGNNLYSDSAIQNVVKYLEKKLEAIQKVSPDTKLVILVAPNHSTIYPETMPDYIQAQRKAGATSKLQQLYAAMKGSDILCPNLTDYLAERRDKLGFLIYNKTDTHWNELGAYYAYECLMNIIAEDYPSAAPIPLDRFDVFTKSVPGGDMLNYLGFNLDTAREIGVFVRPKAFEFVSGYDKPYRMNFENEWTSGEHTCTVSDSTLPTMMMYRDSFSSNLFNFLAESFSSSRFVSMWSYNLDMSWIKTNKPDYVIIETVERNIDNLLGLG